MISLGLFDKYFSKKRLPIRLLAKFLNEKDDISLFAYVVDELGDIYRDFTTEFTRFTVAFSLPRFMQNDFILNLVIKKLFKDYEKRYQELWQVVLFAELSQLNGLLLYFDEKYSEKNRSATKNGEKAGIESSTSLFNMLKKIGVDDIKLNNYLGKISYMQLVVYQSYAIKQQLYDNASKGMGLSEDGIKQLKKQVEELSYLNCERLSVSEGEIAVWETFFTSKAKEDPYTEERAQSLKETLERLYGENNIYYDEYLDDKKNRRKIINDSTTTV